MDPSLLSSIYEKETDRKIILELRLRLDFLQKHRFFGGFILKW